MGQRYTERERPESASQQSASMGYFKDRNIPTLETARKVGDMYIQCVVSVNDW